MIVTGKDSNENLQNLESVLSRLQEYNLKVNLAKCQFQEKLEFYGHQIDKLCIHETKDKIKAIRQASSTKRDTAASIYGASKLLLQNFSRYRINAETLPPIPEKIVKKRS